MAVWSDDAGISCAKPLVIKQGAVYSCTASADGEPVTIEITIVDAETGAYTWRDTAQ